MGLAHTGVHLEFFEEKRLTGRLTLVYKRGYSTGKPSEMDEMDAAEALSEIGSRMKKEKPLSIRLETTGEWFDDDFGGSASIAVKIEVEKGMTGRFYAAAWEHMTEWATLSERLPFYIKDATTETRQNSIIDALKTLSKKTKEFEAIRVAAILTKKTQKG